MRRLVEYYAHTREWWGQAIWFYNRMHSNDLPVPDDVFDVVEQAGTADDIPGDYVVYTHRILDFWKLNHRLAEVVLPSN
jgi:hypothetical protein